MPTRSIYTVSRGSALPYGANLQPNGVNFALFVQKNVKVHLLLFDPLTLKLIKEIEVPYETGQVKHLFIEHLVPPFAYAFRITGMKETHVVLDPYAKTVRTAHEWGRKKGTYQPVGLVLEPSKFDWSDDYHPGISKEDLVIYEMHVRGFTRDKSSQVEHPGTFLGVIEKIPYLKDLGVNAVELMPVQEFNENEYIPKNKAFQNKLDQYWGYSTVNFFSPMNRYASSSALGANLFEFKTMVKELHKAGIEVIVDVVYNHTSEGDKSGPTHTFKALCKEAYYLLDASGDYSNYTGCGNTFNCNHPIVIDLILESLRYWVTDLHVDGFRFDLASIFYRGQDGHLMASPSIVEAISKDPVLSSVKLIAEPWDAAGIYQVGGFFPANPRWSEWNGRYRDAVRAFLKGDKSKKGEFATRIAGSEDLFGHDKRLPRNSINFITSHDGFTLRDLVSYNDKHNADNGEDNRDGMNQNESWNCGAEGPTKDKAVLDLRERQMRNFHLALMVSQGVPMLLMGDEYGHTKKGNNNTWCQDNALNWFQWEQCKTNSAFLRFYKKLIQFRKKNPLLRHRKFLRDVDIQWHGFNPFEPLWESDTPFVAYALLDKAHGNDIYIAFNASNETVKVTLPELKNGKTWRWIVNTALPSPHDFREEMHGVRVLGNSFEMSAYSSVLLKAY